MELNGHLQLSTFNVLLALQCPCRCLALYRVARSLHCSYLDSAGQGITIDSIGLAGHLCVN